MDEDEAGLGESAAGAGAGAGGDAPGEVPFAASDPEVITSVPSSPEPTAATAPEEAAPALDVPEGGESGTPAASEEEAPAAASAPDEPVPAAAVFDRTEAVEVG